ncbi:MAG: baseplate J/gp47 family protein [Lewinellaceae bacterium]|nr:baseplate J/gp47 family protein [Lewinellaceae bacterium]
MSWQIGHPIQRDGTSQPQRLPDALRPERNPIDARRTEDLLLFLYKLSEQFAYYNEHNQVDGHWQPFFDELKDGDEEANLNSIRRYLAKAEQRQDNSAFMSILLAFLQMFGHVQQDINSLTKKHLDFYYEKVLGFQRLPPSADVVHLLFELSPQAGQHRISAGTALKAGNDALGNPLTYLTSREIIVNKARLSDIKTTLAEAESGRIYAAEVANSADGLGTPLEGESQSWPIFGHPANMQPGTVGFAVASPLLLLKEGQRFIDLTLSLKEIPDNITENDIQSFIAYGSGEEAWIQLDMAHPASIDRSKRSLHFKMAAQAGQGSIVAYRESTLGNRLRTDFPVLQLRLNPGSPAYDKLSSLKIQEITLVVEVTAAEGAAGVQELQLRNDAGQLDAEGAFQPFGAQPSTNAMFYIGSREVFSKPLDRLSLQLRWAGLPDVANGFADHYASQYDGAYKGNDKFTADVQLLNKRQWAVPLARSVHLFEPVPDGKLIPETRLELAGNQLQQLPLNPGLQAREELDITGSQGFIRLSLNQDFGHSSYVRLFAQVAKGNGEFPNLPYTPTLQSLSLGYVATQKIGLRHKKPGASFFHLQPFGSEQPEPQPALPLLPKLSRGALYLGFEGLEPPQSLQLLFQMAEGSAASPHIVGREDIRWDYLTDKGWREKPLGGAEIFIDTTLGLRKSGIMAFHIGQDATKEGGLLPAGRHWLRATIDKNPAGVARAINIHPQVTTAVFQDQGNDPNHLLQPLPANRITALAESNSAIRKVEQPYASFGGLPAELDCRFYARVSERLRHKQRAITFWDIERLALQQFPALYEAKAIPHTGFGPSGFYSEFLPGQVTVVAIPQLRNQNAANPLQPAASVALLQEVKQYLAPLATRFVGGEEKALHVVNPFYEPVQISCRVGFREGVDAGYCAAQLNEALRRHLSPWAFEAGADVRFGGKLYKSQLLAFVEDQAYVDYVADFRMLHGNTGPGLGQMCVEIDFVVRSDAFGEDKDIAEASTAASILVSADQHIIEVLQPGAYPCDEPEICSQGLGCWYIDIDFVVS